MTESTTKRFKTSSARELVELQDEIVATWIKAVRAKIPTAKDLSNPLIIDTLPKFLSNLAEALDEEHPRKIATESSSISQEHGGERARLSRYSPDHLIQEFQILRDSIVQRLGSKSLTDRDHSIIQASIDTAVCESMMSFFLVHNKIREQFTASLSHDLRNPLAAARMSAEMIQLALNNSNWQESREEIDSLARRIVKVSKRLERMILNLLDTTQIQMGESMRLTISEYEILSIVKDILLDMSRANSSRIHIEGNPHWGFGDGEAIRRAIENLITNALKYGSRETPVTVKIKVKQGRLIVDVHNLGNPIPITEQERLFQAYNRSEAAKHSGEKGWGIGLALVRGVAEAHAGSIVVESSAEFGTTFTFDIPLDARPYVQAAPA